METKAAVAWEAGKPLSIETVNLDGPKEGEVLVEVKATGICHTDEFTRSGADPGGPVSGDSRPRRRRRGGRYGSRRDFVEERRPRHSALYAGMPSVRVLHIRQDESLSGDPDYPGVRV